MPWNRIRSFARRSILKVMRRILLSAEGRQLLAEAMPDVHPAVALPSDSSRQLAAEYPDLGVANGENNQAAFASSDGPIFITARFRSGSTLLWNLFRHLPDCTAYYEPLNERRWFDAATRGNRVDASHQGIEDYWREYDGLTQLTAYFQADWNDRRLYMDASFSAPLLRQYLQALIEHASGRAVLQFNRVDFRLPWLRKHFPTARIVHLVRHPRATWYSTLPGEQRVPRDVSVDAFRRYDNYYLLNWVADLRPQFPALGDPRLTHPYQLHYCLWRLSYAFGQHYSDVHLSYESLLAEPVPALERLLTALTMDATPASNLAQFIKPQPTDAWREYADESWYYRLECACEELLSEYDPAAAQTSLAALATAAATS